MSDVTLKQVDSMRVASAQAVIADMAGIGQTFAQLFGLVGSYVPPEQIAGVPMALYHDTDDRQSDMHVEVVFPLREDLPGTDQVRVYELPGAEMACITHRGSFEGIGFTYQSIFAWLEVHGYRNLPPSREIYLVFNPADPTNNVTEIQIPVVKA
jgi:effector-binding domain-containing protein